MSRLHEIKTKGPDNVMLTPYHQTTRIKTVGDRLRQIKGEIEDDD